MQARYAPFRKCAGMQTLTSLATHPSPGGRPQPLAFLAGNLWVGCWDTMRLYAMDPATWTVRDEIALPGIPYGVAAFEGALRVVVSIGEDDDRYVYHVEPGKPVTEVGRFACPDLSGSHLTASNSSLYLVQQTHRTLLEIGADGAVKRKIAMSTRCGGIAFAESGFHLIVADDEFDVLELATLDLDTPDARPSTFAPMDVDARGLAYDGKSWWTCRREQNEITSFNV